MESHHSVVCQENKWRAVRYGLDGKLLDAADRLVEVLEKQTFPEGPEPPSLIAAVTNKEKRLQALDKYGALRKHVERSLYARSLKRFESELQISGKHIK